MRLAGVHQPHPLHGVCGFQFLGCARTLGKLRDNEVKAATDGGFNLGAMLIEGFACDKGGVEVGAVALKVSCWKPLRMASSSIEEIQSRRIGLEHPARQ